MNCRQQQFPSQPTLKYVLNRDDSEGWNNFQKLLDTEFNTNIQLTVIPTSHQEIDNYAINLTNIIDEITSKTVLWTPVKEQKRTRTRTTTHQY